MAVDTKPDSMDIFKIEGNSLSAMTIAMAEYGSRPQDNGAEIFFREIYPIRSIAKDASRSDRLETSFTRLEDKAPTSVPMDIAANTGRSV